VLLRALAALRSSSRRTSFNAKIVAREFAAGLREEVDFNREARVAQEIAANLADDDAVVVPSIFASHSSRRVLTMSLQPTLRLERAELQRADVDCRSVLKTLARAYGKQVFVDGLFHADPHPGNLFVLENADEPEKPQVLFVDFGLSRRLKPELRLALRGAMYAMLQRKPEAFIDRMGEMGMIAPGARSDVERGVGEMFERIASEGGALALSRGQVLGIKDEAKRLLAVARTIYVVPASD